MATGASTANLAIILVDARNGVLRQSRRHAFISSLLGIQHIVVAVNKMDLVEYSEEVFNKICAEFADYASRLQAPDLHFIPISALNGDNVVGKSRTCRGLKARACSTTSKPYTSQATATSLSSVSRCNMSCGRT